MVKVSLQISATLEHVEKLYTNHPNHTFFLQLQCLNCGVCPDKWHDVMESKTYPSKIGKSDIHFSARCKLCGRENNLSVLNGTNAKYYKEDQGKFKSIVTFECRGIEPVQFTPSDGWIVEVEDSGKMFHDINLTEKEWVDYDETINQSVGIYDFKSQFVKIK